MEFLKKIPPREYQKEILKTCIEKNCLVILPTGLGKTLIALMLSVERLTKFPGEKIVFLAPTRPLTEQHFNYFKKNLPELFGSLGLFTGRVKPQRRKEIWETSNIIFSTPQCIANDIKRGLYDLKQVCLLVEDEAHRCIKNYDYTYIAKKYTEMADHPRLLGLTASPGSDMDKIKEICKNLSIEEVEIRTRESKDVKPYLPELTFEKITVEFPKEFLDIKNALLKLFENCVEELRNRGVFFGPPTKKELVELQKKLIIELNKGTQNYNLLLSSSACARALKIQHAIELLETQTVAGFSNYLKELIQKANKKENKAVLRLVSKPEFNYVLKK
ncbi:MAG: DEAD/DEAH box helicase family protein, partial [Candidatus Pacearchaeota archaeon]